MKGGTMPWFVIQTERKTWTKYVVEAANEEEATYSDDNWHYIGYLDGDDTDSEVVGEFPTKKAAFADAVSYVDG
jgi:hypothetical protein